MAILLLQDDTWVNASGTSCFECMCPLCDVCEWRCSQKPHQRPADHAEGLCPCVFFWFFSPHCFLCYFPQRDLVVGFHSFSLLLYLV